METNSCVVFQKFMGSPKSIVKHFILAARAGHDEALALEGVKIGYT